jgi:hypothetical protein
MTRGYSLAVVPMAWYACLIYGPTSAQIVLHLFLTAAVPIVTGAAGWLRPVHYPRGEEAPWES